MQTSISLVWCICQQQFECVLVIEHLFVDCLKRIIVAGQVFHCHSLAAPSVYFVHLDSIIYGRDLIIKMSQHLHTCQYCAPVQFYQLSRIPSDNVLLVFAISLECLCSILVMT